MHKIKRSLNSHVQWELMQIFLREMSKEWKSHSSDADCYFLHCSMSLDYYISL